MTYLEFLDILSSKAESAFAQFQKRLIFTKYKIMGVRTPTLRKLAKEYAADFEEIFAFPNEYYEVVFIKLTMVAALPYHRFLEKLEDCVALMDNWALCDSFKAKCLKRHKEEFLPALLVVLLAEYVEQKYLPTIESFIRHANTAFYYVHMAVAWLLAEVLVKEYDQGIELLNKRIVDIKTHNKAIQKAIESYRLNQEQKEFLRSLKIKTKSNL